LFLLDIMLNVLFFGRSSDLNWRSGGCWRETSAADLELAGRIDYPGQAPIIVGATGFEASVPRSTSKIITRMG
jgi:hypothetical protein